MSPRFCSIYDPYFWWHERFWKMSAGGFLGLFNGTPMKAVVWRLLGVRMGRRVFDDGCAIPEKTLVHIGDDVRAERGERAAGALARGRGLQVRPHRDRARCHGRSPRVRALRDVVHEGAVLDADAFLMKGQEVPAHTRWRGNPAAETREPLVAPPTAASAPVPARS